ncbi:rhomboid family intramembrane serine protease [Brevibacterium sp. 50QC2O2]|uniref:rhomboid family intramembrane serine protease n=1 Tax=Brevibacterium sp. 50QC2O2 TaxID=2968459 RepID=UPI00211BB9F8|nr:rhomboid family intramembrane serine protease [Brevibacterium sp. 50QC2O2]MCQ9387347.1 rhomboid family intramembrane serine protease [Brevibacterium sp. 50QC2O2]
MRSYGLCFLSPVLLLVLMWVIRGLEWFVPGGLTHLGLTSWRPASLAGVVASPLLHADWPHLLANSAPFLILGCLVTTAGVARFWIVTAVGALASGLAAFILNPPGVTTVGASGLIFAYFAYLLLAGFYAPDWPRRIGLWAVALLVFGAYGASLFAGLVPGTAGVSWQGHLGGACGGLVCARLPAGSRAAGRRTPPQSGLEM